MVSCGPDDAASELKSVAAGIASPSGSPPMTPVMNAMMMSDPITPKVVRQNPILFFPALPDLDRTPAAFAGWPVASVRGCPQWGHVGVASETLPP